MPNNVKETRKPNLLITQKSPYLLQHAYNPVEWHPWGKQALDLAKEKDKPILLSIGYSSCHWCHVMETEVFEDNEAAEAINHAFVAIKVDREERPDLDGIYMSVAQMLNGSGGWPLNIIMTPDKQPFFAGTYIPKLTMHGRIGMIDLSKRITDMWRGDRAELVKAGSAITKALIEGANPPSATQSGNEDFKGAIEGSLQGAYIDLSTRFDEENGGFGHAPKFPTPQTIQFMLRYWRRFGNARALQMAEQTMTAMRSGGIFDHLGFGFHRYSTDERWLVPHFEKMLYDQALISTASIELFLATGKAEYRKITEEVFTYVLRDLSGVEGGFHCGEDADSEGVEGKFYTWREHEIDAVLDSAQGAFVKETFNVEASGNFQDESTGMKTGANILHTRGPELSKESEQDLSSAREKLLLTRDKRVRPMKDDKVLCDWNALMISALAKGAGAFNNDLYLQGAKRSADFILKSMRLPNGRLLHRYRLGESAIDGFADDYVFLITALIDLYEITFNASYLERALELQDILIEDFWDTDGGGFFFTSKANTDVLVRQKNFYDGAVPSANSMAILNMVKLARMTGRMDLEAKALQLAGLFIPMSASSGPAYANFLISADFLLGPSFEVVIAGETDAVDTARLLRAISKEFLPNTVLLFRPTDTASPRICDISPFTKGLAALERRATAYVCKDQTCLKPTLDIHEMLEYLYLDDKMDL